MTPSIAALITAIDFERHCLFDTADLDEVRHVSGRVFSPHHLQVLDRGRTLHARMASLRMDQMSFNRLRWGAPMHVDPDRLDDYYLLTMPLRGQAQFHVGAQTVDVSPRTAAVVSPQQRFHFRTTADYDQVVIRLSANVMRQAWSALSGEAAPAVVRFDAAMPLQGSAWSALAPMVDWLARCTRSLDRGQMPPGGLLLSRSEELLATALLMHQPHDLVARLWPSPPSAEHAALRRAEAFMQERLEQPLTAADVASHCQLSVRRIQALFQSKYDMGPIQWLRGQRLQAAHAALLTADTGRAAVSQVAMRFQFSNLGDFSRLYRESFGETPRQTLLRRAGRTPTDPAA